MASLYEKRMKSTRIKKRAPLFNQTGTPHFFYYPIKDVCGFYDYFMKRLVKNEQLNNERDGVYTWIMTAPHEVYAMRTCSNQEIGTLHGNIIEYIREIEKGRPAPVASGELQITTDSETGVKHVQFNFQSSFFVSEILKRGAKQAQQTEEEFQRALVEPVMARFQELFPQGEVTAVLGVDLIEPVRFLTSPSAIRAYERFLTRRSVLPEHRALTYTRSMINQGNAAANAATNVAANVAANTSVNAIKKNTYKRKTYSITNVKRTINKTRKKAPSIKK